MGVATKVGPAGKSFLGDEWPGDVAHYKLDPAFQGVEHVIVSSVTDFMGDDTAAFPATPGGDADHAAYMNHNYKVPNMATLSHAHLLESLGYEVRES